MGAAGGVTWMILVFYVPLIVVSVALLLWQLYRRRNESLDQAHEPAASGGNVSSQIDVQARSRAF
jgi:hypothetical protein